METSKRRRTSERKRNREKELRLKQEKDEKEWNLILKDHQGELKITFRVERFGHDDYYCSGAELKYEDEERIEYLSEPDLVKFFQAKDMSYKMNVAFFPEKKQWIFFDPRRVSSEKIPTLFCSWRECWTNEKFDTAVEEHPLPFLCDFHDIVIHTILKIENDEQK